jgi:predicted transcriptional regulator
MASVISVALASAAIPATPICEVVRSAPTITNSAQQSSHKFLTIRMIQSNIVDKVRLLVDAVRRDKDGKRLTAAHLDALERLDRENKPRADRWTVTDAANLLGVDPKTVKAGLRRIGIEPEHSKSYSVRECVAAVYGNAEMERERKLRLENEKLEREAKIEAGELVPMADIEPWLLQHYIVPMAGILSSAPTTLDTRCNPEHPEVARKAIADWIEGTVKPSIREGLEKPKHRKSK